MKSQAQEVNLVLPGKAPEDEEEEAVEEAEEEGILIVSNECCA